MLCIYLTKIFFRIPDVSISSYPFDQNIRAHLHFFASTRPKYSCASPTSPFLRIYSTKIFLRIPDTSISTYLLDQIFLRIPDTSNSMYLLVKSYCATVDVPSGTVPSGQCSDYNTTLATCSVDRGSAVDSNVGWTTIHSKSRRGKSNGQVMEDQRTFPSCYI